MREQFERKSAGDNVRIAQLEKQAADLQDKLTALTRGGHTTTHVPSAPPRVHALCTHTRTAADYLVQRYKFSVREREHHDALAAAEALRLSAETDAARVSQHASVEARVLRGAADQQARALAHLRSSAELARAQDAQVSEAQRAALEAALRSDVEACRAELAKERERCVPLLLPRARTPVQVHASDGRPAPYLRYRALQQRRALEMEGFNTDVTQLRAALRRVERQWSLVHGVVADAALADQV